MHDSYIGFARHNQSQTGKPQRYLRHLFSRNAIDEAVDLLLDINRTTTAYARLFGQAESLQLVAATRNILVDRLQTASPAMALLKQLR